MQREAEDREERLAVPTTAASPPHLESRSDEQMFRWAGHPLTLTAALLPRTLYMTASIDVLLDGRAILRTRGQRQVVGTVTERFVLDDVEHEIALHWEAAAGLTFPVTVHIDGELVAERPVRVRNGFMMLVAPLALFFFTALAGVLIGLGAKG